ncbi:Rbp4, partial [Drosophila busckii]
RPNGTIPAAEVVDVCPADSSMSASLEEKNEHLRKIFVGGLSVITTTITMRQFFSQFGEVADAVVMRDPISNRSRGFGFVTYVEPGAVENVQRARPHVIDGKTVDTKRAFPRHEFNRAIGHLSNVKTTKIFLGGLKDCHDESALREYFSKFGNVSSVKVLLDKETGRKRGFGFLEFEEASGAARALAQSKHLINFLTVEVKKSTQIIDASKRVRLPVGGAAFAGYAPPQLTTMDTLVYNPSYNPYQAQTSLPPSAFFNGWASYVAPTAAQPVSTPYVQPPYAAHANGWPYVKPPYILPDWARNAAAGSNNLWPPKSGRKLNQSPVLSTERPKNDYKSVQAEEQAAAVASDGINLESDALAIEKKWLAKDYKIFKPSGKYNFNPTQNNHNKENALTPAYGK